MYTINETEKRKKKEETRGEAEEFASSYSWVSMQGGELGAVIYEGKGIDIAAVQSVTCQMVGSRAGQMVGVGPPRD